jgi:DNA-binding transcriptional regulator YiaG
MASIGKVFDQEVRRLARKEFESCAKAIHADIRVLRREIRALERQIELLNQAVADSDSAGSGRGEKMVFTSDSLRKLRGELGVSQREMAELVGVSTQAVYLWERRGGPLRLRNSTRRILGHVRKMDRDTVEKVLNGEAAIPV